MSYKKLIYREIFRQKKTAMIALVVAVLSSLITILVPISIGKFYQLMFDLDGSKAAFLDFLPDLFFASVPNFLWFFGALLIGKLIFGYYQRYLTSSLGEDTVHSLRARLFEHQLHMDMKVYDEKGIGKYLLRYSGDLNSIRRYVSKGVVGFWADIMLLTMMLLFLTLLNIQLAVICLISIAVMTIPLIFLNRQLYISSEKSRNRKSAMLAFVNERLSRILTIKTLNRSTPELKKFHKKSDRLYEANLTYYKQSSFLLSLIPTLSYAMVGIIMAFIYIKNIQGYTFNEGALLASFLMIITVLPVFRRILRVSMVWKLGKISILKLKKVLDLPISQPQNAADLVFEPVTIQLKNVNWQQQDQFIFKQFTHTWNGNGIHILKGGMGSGKTSFIKILTGVYSIDSGSILLGKQLLDEINAKSLKKHIAVVSADYELLGKTVFEAISYNTKKRKRMSAERMLNKVQEGLGENVRMTLDMRIGPNGENLSHGQKMMLNITRGLLTRKPIIIFDEPFRSLDAPSQKQIEKIIDQLQRKHMIFVLMKPNTTTSLKATSEVNLDQIASTSNAGTLRKIV